MSALYNIDRNALRQFVQSPSGPVALDLLRRGRNVETLAKRLCPVRKTGGGGQLRASITHYLATDALGLICLIGSSLSYACVFDWKTSVTTSEGNKQIGNVRPGDLVLTQTGEFRPVLAASRFPVTEKPDLVEINVPWRRGTDHRLTVTTDHKVLVQRDGTNKWVEAGDLTMSDQFFVRSKIPHNAGTRAKRICDHCGSIYGSAEQNGRRFCSPSCRDEYWRAHGHWMLGKDRGAEFSARQSEIRKAMYAEHPEKHPNRAGRRVTDVELTLAMWLALRDKSFEYGYRMGRWWTDFFVASEHRVYEADGAYWHQDQQKDIARDRALLELEPDLEIVHVHFRDARFSPTLEPNPLPNVYYVTVNPSPESFVEPTVFDLRQPISLRAYRYGKVLKPKGSNVPLLYDLTVDGDHSFLASGLLVSNSYVHEGSGVYGPQGTPIVPKRAKMLRWLGDDGAPVFAKSSRGTPGRPFLTDALVAARD